MDRKVLLECIDFFNEIKVIEEEITTNDEKANHQKAVIAKYFYNGKEFNTKKLYYKEIQHQSDVRNSQSIRSYFEQDVYWLDIDEHKWPQEKGKAELESIVIGDMVNNEDNMFKNFLKQIANNNETGYIQKITQEGKSAQYSYNFENNNHWHDIILLIQAIINSRGEEVDKKCFSRLVFQWDRNNQGRSSLAKQVENSQRLFIDNLYENIKNIQPIISIMEVQKILKQKGQIILQGPPGTGKTYTAKDIAEQMIFSKVSDDKKQQKALLEKSDQFKLIQFHPAYSYEDFVRGIVAESKGNAIEYKTKNKILADFAKLALESPFDSNNVKVQLTDKSIDEIFKQFVESIKNILDNGGKYPLKNQNTFLKDVRNKHFLINDYNIPFQRIIDMYNENITDFKKWEKAGFSKIIKVSDILNNKEEFRYNEKNRTYDLIEDFYFRIDLEVLELFKNFMQGQEKSNVTTKEINEKPYVLIIDEINRANLPAVLGELIYALEYRGEKVESMYSIENDNTLVIPPNLYIIGTMNTSDRSVGHIDYAIRRRFAFIDVLPKVLEGDNFEKEAFKKVSGLFIKNFNEYAKNNNVELIPSEHLSEEFRPEDVWLGHSYFIKGEDFSMRMKYEIIPILKEYIKDGILKQSAKTEIKNL